MVCSIAGSGLAKAQLLVPAASFFTYDLAFQRIFSPGVKVSIAGLVAFFAGDICNSYVLAKMKIRDQGKTTAPTSTHSSYVSSSKFLRFTPEGLETTPAPFGWRIP
jgi:uncharacterized PurR-regulated membrane protein YhhQ (DUF165 family)